MSTEDDSEKRNQGKPIIGTRVDAAELFRLLESHDSHIADEVKALIYDNLNSTKESWLLNALVEYYIGTQSSRCIEILTGIREPHDKHLFDKLNDIIKSDLRQEALVLLGHIVRCQPSWLHRIASHRLMHTLLNMLKTDTEATNLMSALLIMVTLLPMIPSLFGPFLQDIFEVFCRIAAWKVKKPGKVPDVHFLYLHVALYSLFHTVYALYPCNFLAYLRSFYGSRDHSRENLLVFTETIKPMLERVRLHPLLVTGSKENEIMAARWKNMETHDVIVQCANVSLDPIEGTQETAPCSNVWQEMSNSSHAFHSPVVRQSSLYGDNNAAPIEAGSIMHETLQQLSNNSNSAVSPLFISDLSPTSAFQDIDQEDNDEEEVMNLLTTPTSHVVKPTSRSTSETREVESSVVDRKCHEESGQECSAQQSSQEIDTHASLISDEGRFCSLAADVPTVDVVQAEEATEDNAGATEKMRSGILMVESSQQNSNSVKDSNLCTNFVSTTANLTAAVSPCGDSLQHESSGEALEHEEDFVGSMKDDGKTTNVLIQRLVHGMTRLRFFSHCVHSPDIPVEWIRRTPVIKKSSSCPDLLSIAGKEAITEVKQHSSPENQKVAEVVPSILKETESSKNATAKEEFPLQLPVIFPITSTEQSTPGNQCLLQPLPAVVSLGTSGEPKPFSLLSPPEILDRHMQLGCEIYLKELNVLPLTSSKDVDWSHFGGAPQAEELNILRGQISLLHNQLQFERYRRGVHAERNRRLLGYAKKARALEEQNSAMKDQLLLQEKEINEMNKKMHELNQKLQHASVAKPDQDLHDHLRLLMQDNKQLDVDKKEMQYRLDVQKKEIQMLKKHLDETQASLFETKLELDVASKQADKCTQLEEQLKSKTKQLTVLYELYGRYKDKMENLPKQPDFEFQMQLLENSYKNEIEELKQTVKNQYLQLDYLKTKVDNLEKNLASKDLIITELKQLLERIKDLNGEELKSKESHLSAHKQIILRQEQHIMELTHKICMLNGGSIPKDMPAFPGCRDFSDLLTPLLHPVLSGPLENFCQAEDSSNGEDVNAGNSSSLDMDSVSAQWEAGATSDTVHSAESFTD